jgi:hypothetical protein
VKFRRRVGESARDSYVFAFAEDGFRSEGIDAPVLRNIVESLTNGIHAMAGSAPRYDLMKVGVAKI